MTPSKAQSLANDIACTIATLQAIADELMTAYTDSDYSTDETNESSAVQEPQALTFEQVKKALAEKTRDGHTTAIRELLDGYGVKKLSDVSAEHYAEILKAVEGMT